MKRAAVFLILVLSAVPSFAQKAGGFDDDRFGSNPWFSTFSIITYDPVTNEHGGAVASRPNAVGAAVLYAVPGVGSVATQAGTNRTFGPKAIALLQQGLTPEAVIKRITDEDPERDRRQVAVIDAKGRSAVFTGRIVISRDKDPEDIVHYGAYSGHVTGESFSVQGNTLASRAVVEAMAAAYEAGKGKKSMAERLMDALDAGNDKGGDVRGMGSAAILVVRPPRPDEITSVGRTVDLRVDHHENPFKELRRILNMSLTGPHVQRSAQLAQEGKFAEAVAEQKKALELNPVSDVINYTLAERYVQAGEYLNALLTLKEAIRLQPRYKIEAPRNPAFEKMKEFPEFRRLLER